MAGKSKLAPPTTPVNPHEVKLDNDVMQVAAGSAHGGFQMKLLNDLINCISSATLTSDGQDVGRARKILTGSTIAALKAFEPKDEIEGMIATAAVALHSMSMECCRRAMLGQQTYEISSRLRKDAVNAARGMTDMLAALDRKRGKGQQHIRVEKVMVTEGGQAIVGNVTAGVPGVAGPLTAAPLEQKTAVPIDVMAQADKVGGVE